MADLVFPQLSSGALAQYPIRKTRIGRTIRNLLPDGSMVSAPDVDAAKLVWQLGYTALVPQDLNALTAHFAACQGRLKSFTFLDPTDNLLDNSSGFTGPAWQASSTIKLVGNSPDPNGTAMGFAATNNGQANAAISQTLAIPASFQYCFSIYASSAYNTELTIARRGPAAQDMQTLPVGPRWTRLVNGGRMSDPGATVTISIWLSAGQRISLFGPQLEAQLSPSRYRPTIRSGGVYPNAHWAIDELPVSADAPDLFSTAFSIETAI